MSLTNAALNTWQTAFNVTPATPSGFVTVLTTAQDQAGNVFVGAPLGPALIIDTTPPSGAIATAPAPPIQATNSTNVNVSLTLSKLAGAGTTPTLSFVPPVGLSVHVTLTGAGSNWLGSLVLTPGMGSGFGMFVMSAQDGLGNVGTNILTGGQLEIFNTALPSPPAVPAGLTATSLAGGQIRLWLEHGQQRANLPALPRAGIELLAARSFGSGQSDHQRRAGLAARRRYL
jgi:hypothetical protein